MQQQTINPHNLWVVWTDAQDHIASFHPVEGYREQCFRSHDYFLEFLHSLQQQSYRFQ